MKGLLFLGFIGVLLFVAYSMTQKEKEKEKVVEKFADCAPTVNVPKVKVNPTALDTSSPAAYLPPVETVYGPAFGEISRVGSLPYKDPTAQPAPLKNLNETLVSIQGFMNFEAKSLEDQSDPSIQLPLTTVRGDQERLNSEVSVLKRNPGIDSSITQGQLDDILNNLRFLQKKHRTLTNAGSTASLEGFENPGDDRITLAELKDTLISIQAEMARLSASGTTDPVITARVNTLTQMKNNVQGIVDQVASGAMPERQIPILKTDKGKFLPVMSDPTQPLPKLINQAKLPPSLANLFPAYQSGDITGAKLAQTLAESYGDSIFKGLSWGLNLKFTSPNEVEVSRSTATSRLGKAASMGLDFNNVADISGNTAHAYVNHPYDNHMPKQEARGEFEGATQSYDETRPELRVNGIKAKTEPAKLDWKQRSQAICQNIKKAGYNPKDFGCLDTNIKVGRDYSWRGNARMVCTRLLSTPDPGLPETCGCPPVEWRGWKA